MESHYYFWQAVTRLGESEILLPAFLAGSLWLALARPSGARGRIAHGSARADDHPARDVALRWVAALFATAVVTTISKIAFLGFGIGSAELDFTGFSGHSMFSTGILPVLGAVILGRKGVVLGVVLALVVMYSRVVVGAHSWSEAITGVMLGAAVSWWTLALYLRQPGAVRAPWWLPIVLVAWLALLPNVAPRSQAHGMVIAVSLKLSGRTQPYTREELLAGLIRTADGSL